MLHLQIAFNLHRHPCRKIVLVPVLSKQNMVSILESYANSNLEVELIMSVAIMQYIIIISRNEQIVDSLLIDRLCCYSLISKDHSQLLNIENFGGALSGDKANVVILLYCILHNNYYTQIKAREYYCGGSKNWMYDSFLHTVLCMSVNSPNPFQICPWKCGMHVMM